MTSKKTEPQFSEIWLLHGKGGSPAGTVAKFEALLSPMFPGVKCFRPELPHSNSAVRAEKSVLFLEQSGVTPNALIVGVSFGGLVGAKLQEQSRPDLRVVCISSPTWADAVFLQQRVRSRLALYSSADEVIESRVREWPKLAESYDLFSLAHHNPDPHLGFLSLVIRDYVNGEPVEVSVRKHCEHHPKMGLTLTVFQCLNCRQIIRRLSGTDKVIALDDLGSGWYVDEHGWIRERQ